MSDAARALVTSFERSVDRERRRDTGVHYTPPEVAGVVVSEAFDALGAVPAVVCDPTCGAGSFLLAAADALVAAGVPAREVVERRLVGGELDPAAVETARRALQLWAEHQGVRGTVRIRLMSGESLLRAPEAWEGRPGAGFDVVVGNPPFLNQLSRRTARSAAHRALIEERFGLASRYADTAGLFLLGALDMVRPGGVVAMLQPQSFLAGRDTAPIRARLGQRASLRTLWASPDRHFDASVLVCAPVLQRGAVTGGAGEVRVRWGIGGASTVATQVAVAAGRSWGSLLSGVHDIPAVGPFEGPTLGEVATATAGFRDEYYGLRDACVDDPAGLGPPLVTVGTIEPGWSTWGERPRRFGGQLRTAPRLDVAALERAAPRVARWTRARQVPKVLVATQTRVVEATADPDGHVVPVTPLISVEPRDADAVWAVTAALLAPPVSAWAVAEHLGLGLSAGALRWSASGVLEVPLPSDPQAWRSGADLAAELSRAPKDRRNALLDRLGRTMCGAYGLDPDSDVFTWWRSRVHRP